MAQKNVLGKGLASLLPGASHAGSSKSPILPPAGASANPSAVLPAQSAAAQTATGRDVYMGITMAAISEIQANHLQPRKDFDDETIKELSQSIKTSGIIQPLLVRKGAKSGYELIAGERRLRAAKLAGLKQVPVVIRKSTDREMLELALVENIQRQDLNCVDEALAYFQLTEDFSLKQEEVADRVGKDRATVANYLRLLRLPQAIIEDLRKQSLSFGHGKALLGIEDTETRLKVRDQIIQNKLSVRDTEALIDSIKKAKAEGNLTPEKPENLSTALVHRFMNLSRELARLWSTKVEIKGSDNRGKIIIHYSTRGDLDRILDGMRN